MYGWAREDSNLQPTSYEPGALPLSYRPVAVNYTMLVKSVSSWQKGIDKERNLMYSLYHSRLCSVILITTIVVRLSSSGFDSTGESLCYSKS